jgi:hypothetical protein
MPHPKWGEWVHPLRVAVSGLYKILPERTLPAAVYAGFAEAWPEEVALPRLALERFHIALERFLFHLADTAGNLPPGLSGEAVDKELRALCDPNDPVLALRRARA